MTVRDTSIHTFRDLADSGDLSRMRRKVYQDIYLHAPTTANETFQRLGCPTNQSGRFTELKERGWIKEAGRRACRVTGRTVIEWGIVQDSTEEIEVPKTKLQQARERIEELEAENEQLKKELEQWRSKSLTKTNQKCISSQRKLLSELLMS